MILNNRGSAVLVALGIFLSRIFGFIRDRAFAHYLGNSEAAGCFRAALRIPNLLQNLFGEGALSASFIPVYSKLLSEGKEKEAHEMASTIFSLLTLIVFTLCSLGVAFSEPLTMLLAPGFTESNKALTILLVRIMFPGVGLLVLSAWCLGVLNSNRNFFLPYVAPVLWNLAIILSLVLYGRQNLPEAQLVEFVAWGTVIGSLLQLIVQLPLALKLNNKSLFSWKINSSPTKKVLKNFPPALLSRGVVQISAYVDQVLSSFLGASMVASIAYAQTIALLPISLFGISIATTELPELSRIGGDKASRNQALRNRLNAAYSKISYFVIPSSAAFLFLGGSLVTFILQTGRFTEKDAQVVWLILAAYGIGTLASTFSRLSSSTFWALEDTRTPLKFSLIRVAVNIAMGVLVIRNTNLIQPTYAGAALAASASVSGWLEFFLLQSKLKKEIGHFSWFNKNALKSLTCSFLAGFIGLWVTTLSTDKPIVMSLCSLILFVALYLGMTFMLKLPESRETLNYISRRFLKR